MTKPPPKKLEVKSVAWWVDVVAILFTYGALLPVVIWYRIKTHKKRRSPPAHSALGRTQISAYALVHDQGRILLCRLSKELPRWAGYWTLPGGGLDFGESPEDAVVREVEEETGLVVEVKSIAGIDTIHDTSGSEDFHGIRIIYHVTVTGGTLRHEAAGTTDLCEWHGLDPVPDVPMVELAEAGVHMLQLTFQTKENS